MTPPDYKSLNNFKLLTGIGKMTTPTPPNPLAPLSSLQDPEFPSKFSPTTFLNRASTHATLKYPDLAIGDAYRALLVIDEAFDESSQYHFKVVNEILRPFPKVKAEWGSCTGEPTTATAPMRGTGCAFGVRKYR